MRQKWQYTYQFLPGAPFEMEKRLNDLGADGWELVGQLVPVDPENPYRGDMLFSLANHMSVKRWFAVFKRLMAA